MKFNHKILKTCRQKLGLSQEQAILGLHDEGLDISRNTLISWERGATYPTLNDVPAICRFYGVTVGALFLPKNVIGTLTSTEHPVLGEIVEICPYKPPVLGILGAGGQAPKTTLPPKSNLVCSAGEKKHDFSNE